MSETRKWKLSEKDENGKLHRVYEEKTPTCEQGTQEELDKQWEELKARPLPPYMQRDVE